MSYLLINAGSSSLKLSLLDEDGARIHRAHADWSSHPTRYQVDEAPFEEVPWRRPGPALNRAIADWKARGWRCDELRAIAHRWVHGGPFHESVLVDALVRRQLEDLVALAPLHHPVSLEALDAVTSVFPSLPQIAVFDTAFHATLPEAARVYAVPRSWRVMYGIRRYGFHGLSYAYCARKAAEILERIDDLRLIVCHLGQGCSASAIHETRCVDTTMGFTPLEGLVMATRSGSIDPGMVLSLQRRYGLSAEEIEDALNNQSGLLGLSGISGDLRVVRQAADEGHADSKLAIEIYVRRIRQAIGSLATSLKGLDAIVFTGGVGQNDARLRAEVCDGLEFLGVRIDSARNANQPIDADVASESSAVRVLVIATREDLTMLSEVRRLLNQTIDPRHSKVSTPSSEAIDRRQV
jgi:acetate kinase